MNFPRFVRFEWNTSFVSSLLWCFVSWFLSGTYFSCSSSFWFHDPQASCLFTLVMFIFYFLALHYFHVFILASFMILTTYFFFSSLLASMLGNPTPPKLGLHHLLPSFLQLLKSFNLPPLVFCKSTQIFDFLPSCLQLLGKKLRL